LQVVDHPYGHFYKLKFVGDRPAVDPVDQMGSPIYRRARLQRVFASDGASRFNTGPQFLARYLTASFCPDSGSDRPLSYGRRPWTAVDPVADLGDRSEFVAAAGTRFGVSGHFLIIPPLSPPRILAACHDCSDVSPLAEQVVFLYANQVSGLRGAR
jgi:hypothetical protein